MIVLFGDNLDGEAGLRELLKDQAAVCEKNATDMKPVEYTKSGGKLFKAEGMCQIKGRSSSTSYSVLIADGFAVIVVEMVDATDAINPEISEPKFNAELLASFPVRAAR